MRRLNTNTNSKSNRKHNANTNCHSKTYSNTEASPNPSASPHPSKALERAETQLIERAMTIISKHSTHDHPSNALSYETIH